MHIPVLKEEVLKYLAVESNRNFVDCTAGEGGHLAAILNKNGPRGKVLGIDRDPELIENLRDKMNSDRLKLVCGNFTDLPRIVESSGLKDVHGVLFDFGLCSYHLEQSGRGFSFQEDEPLDMRYNPRQQRITAREIINRSSESKLKRILSEYGEEKYAQRIAEEIVEARKENKINTTSQLISIIEAAVPDSYKNRGIHCATRTFQALRIAVNGELENVKQGLRKSVRVVRSPGRIVAISFHSLEDRTVKRFFRKKARQGKLKILTKKPVASSGEENPRSRSAKLRAARVT